MPSGLPLHDHELVVDSTAQGMASDVSSRPWPTPRNGLGHGSGPARAPKTGTMAVGILAWPSPAAWLGTATVPPWSCVAATVTRHVR
jgi:hypothetical protein